MRLISKKVDGILFIGFLGVSILLAPSISWAYRYRLPEEVIDKHIAQLQPKILNRNELTELEKEEVKKYGYTGLEIQTYFQAQSEPGFNCTDCQSHDSQGFVRLLMINRRGHIRERYLLWRTFGNYPDPPLGTGSYQSEVDPTPDFPLGTKTFGYLGIMSAPPYVRGTAILIINYLETLGKTKDEDQWLWLPNLRRIRKLSAGDKEDGIFGSDFTVDDFGSRKPFEETHKIIGFDTERGYDCFVIESRSRFPDYFAPRRLTWISKKTFLNIHEELFDRIGRLFKILDRYWHNIEPWGDYGRYMMDGVDLSSGHRSVFHYIGRVLNEEYPDSFFTFRQLEKEEVWEEIKSPLPPVKSAKELHEPARVKLEFWKKMGETPEIVR